MLPGTPVQQYAEQAWSQGYQSVNPHTQSGFHQVDVYREFMPPTQPVNLVSQTTPVAPGDSVQRNVPSGQSYQQQYLLYPHVGSLTRPANGPTDAQNPSHSESAPLAPLFQQAQAVLFPLVNQQPLPGPVSAPPPTMQQNGGVAQDSSMRPVYCAQSCPSGSGNCCFQLAFHEHHHHIVPAWPGNAPFIYTGLPSLAQVASPPVQPQASPARNGEQTQPPGGSPATQTEQPNPVPGFADRSNPFYWLTASQTSNHDKPYRIQPSHLGQEALRYVDAQALTQLFRGQNSDPLRNVHNKAPSEASRPQLSRILIPQYAMNPSLYLSPPVNSPQPLYSNVPDQTSRPHGRYFQQVVQYVPQSPVSRPLQHEPAGPAQRDSGQRTVSFQPLPKGF